LVFRLRGLYSRARGAAGLARPENAGRIHAATVTSIAVLPPLQISSVDRKNRHAGPSEGAPAPVALTGRELEALVSPVSCDEFVVPRARRSASAAASPSRLHAFCRHTAQ
jgi:hypothetical protein